MGGYQTVLSSQYYNSKQTVTDIKQSLLNNVHTALTDMNGGELYQPVDVIKMVVKQLKGIKGEHVHSLTVAAITALQRICHECAGTNSTLSERKDKIIGSVYIRAGVVTSQKFQLISSAGKLTNATLSCFN